MNILCIVSFFPQRYTGNLIASFSLTRGLLITNSQALLVLFYVSDVTFLSVIHDSGNKEMRCHTFGGLLRPGWQREDLTD